MKRRAAASRSRPWIVGRVFAERVRLVYHLLADINAANGNLQPSAATSSRRFLIMFFCGIKVALPTLVVFSMFRVVI